MEQAPRVAIVYLAYNSRPYLDAVMQSIAALRYRKDRLHLIIVDNPATDDSATLIRETVLPKSGTELPRVTFFANEKNEGFAEGNNRGIRQALAESADYVFLLNNDAKFHPDAIARAVSLAQTDPAIGSVQSTMLLWQNPSRVNSTGGVVHFLGFGFVRDNGRLLKDVTVADGSEICYASGAAVLYRAEVLRKVGLLDPFLFLYHEDLQLGWRIRLAGYRNVLSRRSIVYHNYEFKRSIAKFYWMERNRLLVHFTHLRWPTLLLLAPFFLGLEIALFPLGLKAGWWGEKVRTYRDLLKPETRAYIRSTRKTVASLRKRRDRDIVRMFTGRILHQETQSVMVNWIANPVLSVCWFALKRMIVW